MTSNKKYDYRTYLSTLLIIGLEIVLCGVQQFVLGEPYSYLYALNAIIYAVIQTMFCLNIDTFSEDGRKGIRYFFLYKMAKLLVVIIPLFIYVVVVNKIDVWVPIRVAAYYFSFLVVETVIMVKRQKNNIIQKTTEVK